MIKYTKEYYPVRFVVHIIGFFLICVVPLVHAEKNKALEYFKQAEEEVSADNYEQAIELYRKAINEKPEDGELVVEKTVLKKVISKGRTSETIENVQLKKANYYPNKRLAEVQAIVDEKYRATNPPVIQLNWMSFEDPTDNNILDGGESGVIALEIENLGKTPAEAMYLDIETMSKNELVIKSNYSNELLNPNQSKIIMLDVDVSKSVTDTMQKIVVQAIDKNGYKSNELEIMLPSKPHQPEKVIVTKINIEDLNGDALIEPTEMVTIRATVANIGLGISDRLTAKLKIGENIYLAPESNNSLELGKIYPGGAKNIQFSFFTNNRFSHNQPLPVDLIVLDQKGTEKYQSDFGLAINIPNNKVVVSVQPRNQKVSLMNKELIDVDMMIPQGNKKNNDAIAVIIGNKNYKKPGLPRVEYAHNDSKIMKEYLVKAMGFDESNILYFEDATNANFIELFGTKDNHKGRVFNHIKPNKSDLFIYYSGHGAPDVKSKNSFFVPVDADPNYISLSGYSLNLFYQNMAKITARQTTIVLDTCFSGNSDGGYLLGSVSPAMVNVNKVKPTLNNSVIFSSTRVDQVSVWYHEKKHSLFTYYFLKGLTGAADFNNDLTVTSSEMGDYVRNSVPYQARRLNGFEQDPTLIQYQDIDLVRFSETRDHIIKTANTF